MLSPASTNQDSSHRGQMAFLRRLARDTEFRVALEDDPKAALGEYGLYLAPEAIPRRVEIPSDDAIEAIFVDSGDDPDIGGQGGQKWMGFLG